MRPWSHSSRSLEQRIAKGWRLPLTVLAISTSILVALIIRSEVNHRFASIDSIAAELEQPVSDYLLFGVKDSIDQTTNRIFMRYPWVNGLEIYFEDSNTHISNISRDPDNLIALTTEVSTIPAYRISVSHSVRSLLYLFLSLLVTMSLVGMFCFIFVRRAKKAVREDLCKPLQEIQESISALLNNQTLIPLRHMVYEEMDQVAQGINRSITLYTQAQEEKRILQDRTFSLLEARIKEAEQNSGDERLLLNSLKSSIQILYDIYPDISDAMKKSHENGDVMRLFSGTLLRVKKNASAIDELMSNWWEGGSMMDTLPRTQTEIKELFSRNIDETPYINKDTLSFVESGSPSPGTQYLCVPVCYELLFTQINVLVSALHNPNLVTENYTTLNFSDEIAEISTVFVIRNIEQQELKCFLDDSSQENSENRTNLRKSMDQLRRILNRFDATAESYPIGESSLLLKLEFFMSAVDKGFSLDTSKKNILVLGSDCDESLAWKDDEHNIIVAKASEPLGPPDLMWDMVCYRPDIYRLNDISALYRAKIFSAILKPGTESVYQQKSLEYVVEPVYKETLINLIAAFDSAEREVDKLFRPFKLNGENH